MKFLVKLSLLVAMSAGTLTASAQYYKIGGMMMDHDGMMSSDMFSLSQVNFGFGTARSMAMAGAFTSLGADASSMGINPAGLGMYRHNEITLSPVISLTSTKNNAQNWGNNEQSRFAMSNFAAVIKLQESASGGLVSANFAIGMNRIADFNYRMGYTAESAPSASPYRSINDAFIRQLGQGGVFPNSQGILNYNYADSYFWGGALAFNNYLIDAYTDEYGDYWTSADRLGANAGIGHTVEEQSRGSINEIDFAVGFNFNNNLYVGATVGIQSVRQKRQLYYGEDYIYNGQVPVYSDGEPLDKLKVAEWMDYNQAIELKGVGVNLKLGMVYRPIESIRLGLAVHTPTGYSLERTYQAYMASNFNKKGDTTRPLEDAGENSWEFYSPTRLMLGGSYTLGRWAIFSVDYERTWYNGMRVTNIPGGFDISQDAYRTEMVSNYKGANTLRAGIEVKPLPILSLRVGYGLQGSALRNAKDLYYNAPTVYRTDCMSAGVGFALGRVSLDFAYQHLKYHRTEYLLYYALDTNGGFFDTASPIYKSDLSRNLLVMTMGIKF